MEYLLAISILIIISGCWWSWDKKPESMAQKIKDMLKGNDEERKRRIAKYFKKDEESDDK